MVVCPFLFEDLDALLSTRIGAPTLLFHLVVLGSMVFGVTLLLGVFVLPNLPDAIATNDPLLGLALIAFSLINIVVVPMTLEEMRQTCRTDGALWGVGAGRPLDGQSAIGITQADAETLRRDNRTHGFRKDARTVVRMLPILCVCLPFLIMGTGLHSPMHNRISAAIAITNIPAFTIFSSWSMSLKIATTLIATRIAAITKAVEREAESAGQDVTAEDWEVLVVAPFRILIAEMAKLTLGWARGLVLNWVNLFWAVIAYTCLGLSPTLAEELSKLGEQLELTWLAGTFRGLFFFLAGVHAYLGLHIATGPAKISTAVDDLQDRLNDIRINDFSRTTDERVLIIERAVANANHGHGIGFRVMGTVLDRAKLNQVGFKILVALQTAAPLVLAMSLDKNAGRVAEDLDCQLTTVQLNAIRATAQAVINGSSCSFNITLNEILSSVAT